MHMHAARKPMLENREITPILKGEMSFATETRLGYYDGLGPAYGGYGSYAYNKIRIGRELRPSLRTLRSDSAPIKRPIS
ncbi:hypothetical protein SAMN05443247_03900 [Bradyrhizobium erythrophlei]|nr:hypothetical protein SAMN05443247_03900 [Bradyrhizobium erythrophlei]